MDRIKKVNYLRENPDGSFPDVEQVPPEEVRELRDRISTLVAADGSPDGPQLIAAIRASSVVLDGYDANAADFRIREVLKQHRILPANKVYLNWSRFEHVDSMLVDDLDDFFPHIWYPSSDDIEVFDADLRWILSVTHDGSVMILTWANT